MYGFGSLNANGGSGTARKNSNVVYGGGSGGRIAFNVTTIYDYKVKRKYIFCLYRYLSIAWVAISCSW